MGYGHGYGKRSAENPKHLTKRSAEAKPYLGGYGLGYGYGYGGLVGHGLHGHGLYGHGLYGHGLFGHGYGKRSAENMKIVSKREAEAKPFGYGLGLGYGLGYGGLYGHGLYGHGLFGHGIFGHGYGKRSTDTSEASNTNEIVKMSADSESSPFLGIGLGHTTAHSSTHYIPGYTYGYNHHYQGGW